MRQSIRCVFAGVLVLSMSAPLFAEPSAKPADADPADDSPKRTLVTVDGKRITEGDLRLFMMTRGVAPELQPALREQILEQLIDRQLMRAFLKKRKAKANQIELDALVARLKKRMQKGDDDPDQVLERLGLTEKKLRAELSLSLAWQTHLHRMVSDARLRDYFHEHQQEFDGTEVTASLIFLRASVDDDAATQAAIEKLRKTRASIADGKMTFEDAAKQFSQAPSRAKGGDVGSFPYRGKMPASITREVFRLKVGELSEPFQTLFGIHLATVTARKPGELSLEDVRDLVRSQLSEQLWSEIVQEQRAQAKFEPVGEGE